MVFRSKLPYTLLYQFLVPPLQLCPNSCQYCFFQFPFQQMKLETANANIILSHILMCFTQFFVKVHQEAVEFEAARCIEFKLLQDTRNIVLQVFFFFVPKFVIRLFCIFGIYQRIDESFLGESEEWFLISLEDSLFDIHEEL